MFLVQLTGQPEPAHGSLYEDVYEHLVSQEVEIQPLVDDTIAAVIQALRRETLRPYTWVRDTTILN